MTAEELGATIDHSLSLWERAGVRDLRHATAFRRNVLNGYTEPTEEISALRSQQAVMNAQAKPASRPWRRFLRFSVRGLILLVLLMGGSLGWIVRIARIEREAAKAARQSGGWVLYDWQERSVHGAVSGEPAAPAWLVKLIGVEYFGRITEGRLGVSGTDATLEPVARLERLQWLRLDRTAVTDLGLLHLRGMSSLSRLDVCGTHVTDAGIAQLKGLVKLKQLELYGTEVTDAGVRELREALPPGMAIGR